MNNIFAVTSGKGGVGKSTVSVGIASALASLGNKTLIIDLDEGLRCLDMLLGMSSEVVLDLADVASGEDKSNAIYNVRAVDNLYLLPAPAKTGSLNKEFFCNFINEVSLEFDCIIVDFPAGIDLTLYKAMPDTVQFITVCNSDPVSIRDASVVNDRLGEIGKKNNRLIINRFEIAYIKEGIYKNIDDIIDISRIRLLGIVPSDFVVMISQAKSIVPKKGRAVKAFLRIAKRLLGQDLPLPKIKKI